MSRKIKEKTYTGDFLLRFLCAKGFYIYAYILTILLLSYSIIPDKQICVICVLNVGVKCEKDPMC